MLPRQRVRVRQSKSDLRVAARCTDEYGYSRPGVLAFEPSDESVAGISVHASVNDFRDRETPKVIMSVDLRWQSRQEREGPWHRDPFRFVLNVIDN